MREIGRIERTLYTLEWLQSPELRRRVQVGLNKGEAKHALARAAFFNRLGEIRDRSYEDQLHRASGLQLLILSNRIMEYGIYITCSRCITCKRRGHSRRIFTTYISTWMGTYYVDR